MQWLIAHPDLALAIVYGVLSEILAIIQLLKYPTNQGFGGIVAGLLKGLLPFMKNPPASA